jgi:hypothetical protein
MILTTERPGTPADPAARERILLVEDHPSCTVSLFIWPCLRTFQFRHCLFPRLIASPASAPMRQSKQPPSASPVRSPVLRLFCPQIQIDVPHRTVRKDSGSMTAHSVEIRIAVKTARFTLHWDSAQWDSPDDVTLADFPLIADLAGRRYELYSDGSFSEVEK